MQNWANFFVPSVHATGTEGHINANDLRQKILEHDGREAYHCAFDLEPRDTFNEYDGNATPALGYVWFDFDSKDGGIAALKDARQFVAWLETPHKDLQIAYSGSKGFHIGVPFSAFNLKADKLLPKTLNSLAKYLKKKHWPTLDTTIYNPNRKFRVLGSRHPKTGLYKRAIDSLDLPFETIKGLAKERGPLEISQPSGVALVTTQRIKEALDASNVAPTATQKNDSISIEEWRKYRQPKGEAAFSQCFFLAHCKANPDKISEPEWYAAASIVGRFENGRAQFHAMSTGHPGYSKVATDEKLDQSLQASGPRTCQGIDALWARCAECPLYGRIKSPVVIMDADVIPTEATGFYDLIPNKEGEVKRVPNYGDLLHAFRRELPYKTIADMSAVFVFNSTHYVDYTPIEIKSFAEKNFQPSPQERVRNEFFHKVLANEVARKSFFGVGTENRINFKNGVLDLDSKELLAHSPEFGFRGVLPYSYDPEALCPTFDWWVRDIMLGDEELVCVLQEFMGYVLRGGEYKYHKALWLAGTGRNGKSTFIDLIKGLIGHDNYSTLSIKQIIQDKFASASLDGKTANFSEETSPEELSDSGPFKNLTGDGELEAQKKYGDPYRFRNRAKLIMSYNEVPVLKDLSPGMLSRPIIIPFKKDLTLEGAQDRNIKKKLMAELPGIFNFALKGWQRLEEQEGFTQSAKSKLELEEIRDASCSAAQWIKENITFLPIDNAKPVKPRALYSAYKSEMGSYAYAEQKFYRRIQAVQNVAMRRRRTEKGVEYFGMLIRSQSDELTQF